jgi:hypothetical protein
LVYSIDVFLFFLHFSHKHPFCNTVASYSNTHYTHLLSSIWASYLSSNHIGAIRVPPYPGTAHRPKLGLAAQVEEERVDVILDVLADGLLLRTHDDGGLPLDLDLLNVGSRGGGISPAPLGCLGDAPFAGGRGAVVASRQRG